MILNKDEVKTVNILFKCKQDYLLELFEIILQEYYDNIIKTDKYIYAVGADPVGLVAHLDTVFSAPPSSIYYDKEQNVMWSPQGLGADDRAGVYGIYRILQDGYRPSILLLADEEIGGIGATFLSLDYPKPLTKLKYLIELDRQGVDDCVFYDYDNKDFEQYVESFGFRTQEGLFSDISIITPVWKIASVNVSIGYINEHTVSETFHIDAFLSTIEKVEKMIDKSYQLENDFEYKEVTNPLSAYSLGYKMTCCRCGKEYDDIQIFDVQSVDGSQILPYCPQCTIDHVNWCVECWKPFEINPHNPTERLCSTCLRKNKKKRGKK